MKNIIKIFNKNFVVKQSIKCSENLNLYLYITNICILMHTKFLLQHKIFYFLELRNEFSLKLASVYQP